MIIEEINVCNEMNSVVLNSLLFFLQKDFARNKKRQKAQKAPKNIKRIKKHKNATKQKPKKANKRTKIKNALKKHLSGQK